MRRETRPVRDRFRPALARAVDFQASPSCWPPQSQFLAAGELLDEAQDAAVAADQQRLRGTLQRDAAGPKPRRLDGHAEGDAVALPKSIEMHFLVFA